MHFLFSELKMGEQSFSKNRKKKPFKVIKTKKQEDA